MYNIYIYIQLNILINNQDRKCYCFILSDVEKKHNPNTLRSIIILKRMSDSPGLDFLPKRLLLKLCAAKQLFINILI